MRTLAFALGFAGVLLAASGCGGQPQTAPNTGAAPATATDSTTAAAAPSVPESDEKSSVAETATQQNDNANPDDVTPEAPAETAAGKAPNTTSAKTPPKIEDEDVDAITYLHDGNGHWIALKTAFKAKREVWYSSDGITFYQQLTISGFADHAKQLLEITYWDARVNPRASIERKDGAWTSYCGKRQTAMTEADADTAKKLAANAKFEPPLWKYTAHALARDDRGTYYYVDKLRDTHGGKGHRLFVGKRGSVTRAKLTNIVSDSEGEIFSTKDGELRVVFSDKRSVWIKGKSERELVNLPLWENRMLIYNDLGIYNERFGTPCDDL